MVGYMISKLYRDPNLITYLLMVKSPIFRHTQHVPTVNSILIIHVVLLDPVCTWTIRRPMPSHFHISMGSSADPLSIAISQCNDLQVDKRHGGICHLRVKTAVCTICSAEQPCTRPTSYSWILHDITICCFSYAITSQCFPFFPW